MEFAEFFNCIQWYVKTRIISLFAVQIAIATTLCRTDSAMSIHDPLLETPCKTPGRLAA